MKTVLRALLIAATLAFPALVGASGPLTFANATYTAPPECVDVYVPSLNPATPLHICAIVRRPESGGGLHLATIFSPGDGVVIGQVDLAQYGYTDAFGASPFASNFSHTLKLVINAKSGDGNDRAFPVIDTGIPAWPAYPLAPPPAQ